MIRFVAPEVGLWALLVDPGSRFAPLAMAETQIGGDLTTLGPVAFLAGSTLRIRVLTASGTDAPRISVVAAKIGQPRYQRSIQGGGADTLELPGLGPGRFRVTLIPLRDHSGMEHREIDVDGSSDLELEYDLR